MAPATWLRTAGPFGLVVAAVLLSLVLLGPPSVPTNAAAPFVASEPSPEPPPGLGVNSVGMRFVRVNPGKFRMGAPKDEQGAEKNEWPQHEVEITKAFHLSVYEVTQGQYEGLMGTNPSIFSKGGTGKAWVRGVDTSNFPVDSVSWNDAQAFLKKLNARPAERKAGWRYRLPTEAEWEYACRGGHHIERLKKRAELPFHFKQPSASLGDGQAQFDSSEPYGGGKVGDGATRTSKVGSFEPNALGVYDMHGNVSEWCQDWYDAGYYARSPRKDPAGPDRGTKRVLRGGSWTDESEACRAAARLFDPPTDRDDDFGFRVVAVRLGPRE